MAYTLFAPACMAKNDSIPDPAPTSKTTYTKPIANSEAKARYILLQYQYVYNFMVTAFICLLSGVCV